MSEEEKTESTEAKETAGISNSDIRKSELFKSVTSKQSEELDAIKSEFEAFKQSIAEQKEAARKAKMEEEGNYKQLIAEETAKREAIEAAHAKQLVTMQLENALARSVKVDNDVWFKGAVAAYGGDAEGITEYIDKLKADESNKMFFEGVPPSGQPAPDSAVPGVPGSKITGSQLAAMRNSPDAEQRQAAIKYTDDYLEKHGSLDGLYK